MKHTIPFAFLFLLALPSSSQNTGILLTPERVFTFDSANEFTEYPGGFDGAEAGSVEVGEIPADPNALSDGQGATITVAPGQVELLMFPSLEVRDHVALFRVSVQSNGPGAAVALAALDGSMDGSIGTNIPANSSIFQGNYQRLVLLYEPPGTNIIPVIQVANMAGEQPVSIYVDNLEVLLIPRGETIPTDLLYGSRAEEPIPGETITIPLDLPEDAKPLEMVLIPAGTFTMGSPEDEQGRFDETQHEVTISRDFYIGKYEVTNAQFRAFRPDHDSMDYDGLSLNGNDQPVVYVSWHDAVAFCEWLSAETGTEFRLPTESEWEYACRAGTTTRRYWGDDLNEDQACGYANVADQTAKSRWSNGTVFNCDDGHPVTAPVGRFRPNDFGLYDMLGNVGEWCQDWNGTYPSGPIVDPVGQPSGFHRVLRGGSWLSPGGVRSANRAGALPGAKDAILGFRLVLVSSQTPSSKPTPTATPTNTPTPTATPLPDDSSRESITIPLDIPEDAKPLEMVLIPAGTFMMGSPEDERGRYDVYDWPPHKVTISQDFYIGKYEVTQAQWEALMSDNPATGMSDNPATGRGEGDDYPVYKVSWIDCQTFIEELNELGHGTFRLPTEAEWEYACRAGTTTRFSFGDALECPDYTTSYDPPTPLYCELADQYMWWSGNNSPYGANVVGLKSPNPWGLYDMHGNISEWCSDWWEESYSKADQVDPAGPESGSYRVIRSGSWLGDAGGCRSASRNYAWPDRGAGVSTSVCVLSFPGLLRRLRTRHQPLRPLPATSQAKPSPSPSIFPKTSSRWRWF